MPPGYAGGSTPGWDPGFLFSRTTWDILHTWAFVVMMIAALLHLIIHWRWIVNVTRRVWLSLVNPVPGTSPDTMTQQNKSRTASHLIRLIHELKTNS